MLLLKSIEKNSALAKCATRFISLTFFIPLLLRNSYSIETISLIDNFFPSTRRIKPLEMSLNLLIENSEASILAQQKVIGQDGKEAQIQVMQEEYYMLTPPVQGDNVYAYTRSELATIESGTSLTITPHVGDNNDIYIYYGNPDADNGFVDNWKDAFYIWWDDFDTDRGWYDYWVFPFSRNGTG